MTSLLQFIANIKLTLSQAIMAVLAGTIGLLIVALRLKDGQLKQARIALLTGQMHEAQAHADANVAAARQKLEEELSK